MKKLFLVFTAIFALCLSALATGSVGINPPQSGVINFTNGIAQQTITFAYPFQSTPVLILYPSATNATPVTNLFVNTTSFEVGVPSGGTNYTVAWVAYLGGTRFESGTNGITSATPLTVTFPNAYFYPPNVVATGLGTNNNVSVSAITSSNFVLTSQSTQIANWISVGTVASPTSPSTGQFPGNNTTIY